MAAAYVCQHAGLLDLSKGRYVTDAPRTSGQALAWRSH